MPIYDSRGLLEGRRLRKCYPLGHVLWPFIFSQASERYARLELDHELIIQKLGHLSFFLYEPDDEFQQKIDDAIDNLARVFKQYTDNGLAFPYEVNGVQWLVFDKPNDKRVNFERREDIDAPAPPEPAYTNWLKEIHGKEWADYHPATVTLTGEEISRKRSAAGKLGAEARWHGKLDGKNDNLPDLPSGADGSLANMALVSGSRPLVVGCKVSGEVNSNSTVQSGNGTVASHTSPPETENTKTNPTEILEGIWRIYKLPESDDDITNFNKLLTGNPWLTGDDIEGVVMWMLYVNNDQYWLKRTRNSADFIRAFRKMHGQYEKCGGYKVAKAAERLGFEKETQAILAGNEEGEVFNVEDVSDEDGLS